MAPRHAAVTLGAMPDDARSTAAHDDPVIRDADGGIVRLVAIMARLRDRERGCPWDIEQDFDSIAPYTIEEGYEVADAIARKDMGALRDELGICCFRSSTMPGWPRRPAPSPSTTWSAAFPTRWCAVTRTYSETTAGTSRPTSRPLDWERLKAAERGAAGALDGVAVGLPALTRAVKLQNRAARVGFDWPDAGAVLDKIAEETAELVEAREAGDAGRVREEYGDLMFVMANLARHLRLDPEAALRDANAKFIRRFAAIEAALADEGRKPAESTLAEMDALWDAAKERGL